jgi:hypothetical protein
MPAVCHCIIFMIYIENQIKLILVIQHPTAANTLGMAKCKII